MKKFIYLLTLSLFVFSSCEKEEEIIDLSTNANKVDKVTICHYNPHNDTWKTMTIPEKQLQRHLDHGDFEGDCNRLTYVPDDVFEYALIYWGYDDVMDDYVSTINISSVEHLDFDDPCCTEPWASYPSGVVYDFTGIEDFVGLKTLFINEHNPSILDLTHNLALTRLSLVHMYNVNFKSIDLSKNTALTYVAFTESTSFETMDLSNNVALIDVFFELNYQLTTINLKNGNNTAITNYHVNSNNVLTCVQVDDPTWSYDNWYWNEFSGYIFSEDCGF